MSPLPHQSPLGSDSSADDHDDDVEFVDGIHVETEQITCWRCDKLYNQALSKCPTCLAFNRTITGSDSAADSSTKSPAIVGVIWSFVAISVASIVCFLGAAFSIDFINANDISVTTQLLGWMGATEIIHTVILVIALLTIHTAPNVFPETSNRILVWCLALPMLAAMLGVNFLYHSLLPGFGGQEPHEISFVDHWPVLLLIGCIQPAIVEEIFFRHLAMKAMLEVVTPTQALLITSLMFALAHLGQPLSLPVLGLIGLVLGYLRLASGSLVLPIIFHFLHNLAVLAWNGSL